MSETTINPTNLDTEEIGTPIEIDTEESVEESAPLTIEEIVQSLTEDMGESITPYAIHRVINSTFEVLGVQKEIRPQMMYNYDRNGLIVKGSKGIKKYTNLQVQEFAVKYVTKHSK